MSFRFDGQVKGQFVVFISQIVLFFIHSYAHPWEIIYIPHFCGVIYSGRDMFFMLIDLFLCFLIVIYYYYYF